jgi:hypothetical protein
MSPSKETAVGILRKPTIADIYVNQLRTRLDEWLTPIYPPDVSEMRVGTIGRFRKGRFERRGHLSELLGGESSFAEKVALAEPTKPSSFSFHSAGSVTLLPQGHVGVAGQDMIKARLAFTGDRAVVASFAGVVEGAVRSPRAFDDLLWGLYLSGDLDPDEIVVSVIRSAASGTVLVNRKGGVDVELSADPGAMASISLEGLGAGVRVGTGSQVSAITTGEDLAVAVRAKGLRNDSATRVEDVLRLEGQGTDRAEEFEGLDVPTILPDDVIADADFDAPEEGEADDDA